MSPKPQFQPGETLNIVRYIPPLPKGATVTVKRIEFRGDEYQYVVEGRRTPEGESIEVWADEIDLKEPLIFEAPRKKRKGSLAFELESALLASTSVSALPDISSNGRSIPAAAPIAEQPRRRRRKSTESVGGLIPTRTGRAGRSRDIDAILFADRPKPTNGEAKSARKLKEKTKLKESSNGGNKADAAKRRSRKTVASSSVESNVASEAIPPDKRLKKAASSASVAKPRSSAAAGPKKKSAPRAVNARTSSKRTAGSMIDSTTKPKASGAPKADRKRTERKRVKATAVQPAVTLEKPIRRPRGSAVPAEAPATKTRKPAARRRKRKSSATPRARGASATVSTKQERAVGSRTKDAAATNGVIEQTMSEPKRGRKSRRANSGSTGIGFLDGLLNAQAFPGGTILSSGTNGTPIVIIIVNAAPVAQLPETTRKRR